MLIKRILCVRYGDFTGAAPADMHYAADAGMHVNYTAPEMHIRVKKPNRTLPSSLGVATETERIIYTYLLLIKSKPHESDRIEGNRFTTGKVLSDVFGRPTRIFFSRPMT